MSEIIFSLRCANYFRKRPILSRIVARVFSPETKRALLPRPISKKFDVSENEKKIFKFLRELGVQMD